MLKIPIYAKMTDARISSGNTVNNSVGVIEVLKTEHDVKNTIVQKLIP
ncbi:MAG: hypothetical protein NTZ19_10890 [Bacteroidetes bacterium]|nr:hypothetical protein [Bacteroidota bacterium]